MRVAGAAGVLRAIAGYAPTVHFYPALTRDPSPRVYGLRLVQHELFYLLVFWSNKVVSNFFKQ